MSHHKKILELSVKAATTESLLSVAHKLCDRNSVTACREIITEASKMVGSMKPTLETIDRLGNALQQQVDAVRRTSAVSALHNLHRKVDMFSDWRCEKLLVFECDSHAASDG